MPPPAATPLPLAHQRPPALAWVTMTAAAAELLRWLEAARGHTQVLAQPMIGVGVQVAEIRTAAGAELAGAVEADTTVEGGMEGFVEVHSEVEVGGMSHL